MLPDSKEINVIDLLITSFVICLYLLILHKTSQLSIVVHSCCAQVLGTTELTESKLTVCMSSHG